MIQSNRSLQLIIWAIFFYIFSSNLFATTTPVLSKQQAAEFTAIKIEYEELQKAHNKLMIDLKKTEQQLVDEIAYSKNAISELEVIKKISSEAIETHHNLQKLTAELQLQQTALDVLEAENQKLRDSERNTFFVYGVCAVLSGVMLSLIIPRLRFKKRYSEWR